MTETISNQYMKTKIKSTFARKAFSSIFDRDNFKSIFGEKKSNQHLTEKHFQINIWRNNYTLSELIHPIEMLSCPSSYEQVKMSSNKTHGQLQRFNTRAWKHHHACVTITTTTTTNATINIATTITTNITMPVSMFIVCLFAPPLHPPRLVDLKWKHMTCPTKGQLPKSLREHICM